MQHPEGSQHDCCVEKSKSQGFPLGTSGRYLQNFNNDRQEKNEIAGTLDGRQIFQEIRNASVAQR
jgi:hypothetical protein